jgi:uncharacterized protein YfkK (UPF0435 family)
MRLYHKKNWLEALLTASFLNKYQVHYKIEKIYSKKISFFNLGIILEENFEEIKKGELYDISKNKTYIGDVQESKARAYNFTWKFPFYKEDFTLKSIIPANDFPA